MTWENSDEDRYGPQWSTKSRKVKASTGYRCVVCGSKDNLNTHHLYYGFRLGPIHIKEPDKEITGWSCVPLCKDHHMSYAHDFSNYVIDKDDNWNNRNTTSFIWLMRWQYCLWSFRAKPVGPILFGVFVFGFGSAFIL